MPKRVLGVVAAVVLATGVTVLEMAAGRRFSRRLAHAVTRWARFQSGRLAGFRYHLAGGHPDASAEGAVLADRVRSMLGTLEHRLDIPRIHVMAEGHTVLLHGDVASERQIDTLVEAATQIPGVENVESHLHVGLLPSETRPSEGERQQVAAHKRSA